MSVVDRLFEQPQHVSPEPLAEFKRLYQVEFHEELSERDALDRAIRLLRLFRAIYRPIRAGRKEMYQSRDSGYNGQ